MPVGNSLDLNRLIGSVPNLTKHAGGKMAESAAVCLDENGHPRPVTLNIRGELTHHCDLQSPAVTSDMRMCYADHVEAAEDAAYGVAILLMTDYTGLPAIEKSRRGGGFDYWLGQNDPLIFNRGARIEISGILNGSEGEIKARTRQKLAQIGLGTLPGYSVIVEFSRPIVEVTKK